MGTVFTKPFFRLRPSIVGLFLLLAIPIFAANIWVGYRTNDRVARETADRLVENARSNTFDSTIALLDPIKSMVKVATKLGEVQTDFFRQEQAAAYLTEMLSGSEHIDSAYVALEDGSFRLSVRVRPGTRILNAEAPPDARVALRWLDRKGPAPAIDRYTFLDTSGVPVGNRESLATYDPRVRPWFKESVANGKRITVSDPYIFGTTGLAGITISMPFYAKNKLAGVVAVDITLQSLSQFLAAHPVSPGSISLILDEDDRIVAHPDPAESVRLADGKLIQNSLTRLANDLPMLAMSARPDQTADRFTFRHPRNGEEYAAMLSPLPGSLGKDWRVMIVAPLADFSRVWTQNNNLLLLYGTLAIVVQILLISIFSRRLARPIEQLQARILDVQDFKPASTQVIHSNVMEIRSLVQAVQTLESSINSFASFVPKGLVRQLLSSNQKLELGGHSRFLTIFFSDLESFSTLAEASPAQELLLRVSAYLEVVTLAVNEEFGTIDKFIGDGVMAFWGAPEHLENHAYHSCVAALKVMQKMEVLNAQWAAQGLAPLNVRIGIHCDSVLVGNIGSTERMSYTVMGDGVNVAARLEGVNKEFGTRICVSHAVFKETGDRLWLRPIRDVTVKGRRGAMEIYELVGIKGGDPSLEASASTIRLCEMTRRAHDIYLRGDVDSARLRYMDVLGEFSSDSVAKAMLEVCNEGIQQSY